MLKSLKKKMKDQAGLTLIELLVVIVILGIIAAVAVPMVMSQREEAEINTNKQTLAVLKDAVNRYETVVGTKPDMADLLGDYIEAEPKCANGNSGFSVSAGVITTSCKGLTASTGSDTDTDTES